MSDSIVVEDCRDINRGAVLDEIPDSLKKYSFALPRFSTRRVSFLSGCFACGHRLSGEKAAARRVDSLESSH